MKIEDILGGSSKRRHRGPRQKRITGISLRPIKLREGGSLPNVGSIHISEIEPTLKRLEKELGVGLIGHTLGSVGKKEFSGDIDIALEIRNDDIPEFLKKLENSSLVDEVQKSSVIMTRTKIVNFDPEKGQDRTGYVQIDFMPSEDTNWLKTYYHAPYEKDSKYKGALRNIALASIAKIAGVKQSDEKIEDGRPMVEERFMLSPRDGLVRVRRTPVPKKSGEGYTKQNNNEIIGGPWTSGDDIARQLNLGTAENLDSFETVFQAIKDNYDPETVQTAAVNFARDKTVQNLGIPSELEEYL